MDGEDLSLAMEKSKFVHYDPSVHEVMQHLLSELTGRSNRGQLIPTSLEGVNCNMTCISQDTRVLASGASTNTRIPVYVKKLASTVVVPGGSTKSERMSGSPVVAVRRAASMRATARNVIFIMLIA
ncbi:hypothetical protein Tco_1127674 [Tanacetum coccineum]